MIPGWRGQALVAVVRAATPYHVFVVRHQQLHRVQSVSHGDGGMVVVRVPSSVLLYIAPLRWLWQCSARIGCVPGVCCLLFVGVDGYDAVNLCTLAPSPSLSLSLGTGVCLQLRSGHHIMCIDPHRRRHT